MEKSASEKNSASENRRNVFLEALQAGTADTETGETRAAAEETPEEASGNAVPEETEEETGELEEAVVPAGDPDMSGRLALRILKILKIVCRPLGKLANTFLAPVLKPFRKSADRITRRDWALFLALIAVIGVSVAAPMWIVRAQNTCRVEESLYVSTMGQLFTWEEGGVFYCEDTVTTFTPADGEALTLSGTPFYYSDGSGLLWPNLGVWYSVEKDKSWGRVSRFSQVSAEQGSCVITTAKGEEYQKTGFLYDNADTYLFLESVTLYYNDTELLLPSLSCVKVQNGTTIEIYSYGGESLAEILTTDVTADFSSGASLDLSGDILYYYNGTFQLIYCDLENIPLIQE